MYYPKLLLLMGLFIPCNIIAQIKGFVLDMETHTPLPAAHIKTHKEHVTANSQGAFSTAYASDTLIISHIGYGNDTLVNPQLSTQNYIYLIPVYTQLEQIIVNAGASSHKLLEMPASVSLLHAKTLHESSGISYVEQLNQVPGIFVHQGSLNTHRITIRGIGSRNPYATNRIKAYYNGIPLTTGDGNTEIEDINRSAINTIEILKGSKSAMYGSGLGGVILISGKTLQKEGLHGHGSIEKASFNTLKPVFGIAYKKNKLSLSSQYGYTHSDGWRQNSSYDRHNVNITGSYVTSTSKTVGFVQFIDTKAFIPSSLNKNTFENNPDSAARNWLSVGGFETYTKAIAGVNHHQYLTENISHSSILFASYYKGYESRPFNILSDNSNSFGIRDIMAYTSQHIKLQGGIEVLFENYHWRIYETQSGTQGQQESQYAENRLPLSLFLNGTYTFKKGGIIEAGVSYNYLKYALSDEFADGVDVSGIYAYKPVLSPFAGVNFPIKKSLHMYASLSHGFSAPSVEETLLPDGQINPRLKPETGLNMETGVRWTALEGNFFMDAGIYTLWVNNLLVTERESEAIFYGKNAGKTTHKGIEISSSLRMNEQQRFHLPQTRIQVSYQYAHHTFTHFIDDGISFNNKYLPGIPDHTLWTSIVFNYNSGLQLHTQMQYTGRQFLNDANSGSLTPYALAHAKVGYTFISSNKASYAISMGVKNIFNTHYASMIVVNAPSFGSSLPRYYYPGQARSFYASLSIEF